MFALVLIAAMTQPCRGDLNQSDLDRCWLQQAEIAQHDLDKAYADVKVTMAKLGIGSKPISAAQTAWTSALEKTCAFEESLEEGGSIAPMMNSECQARMTQARTARLKSLKTALAKNGAPPDAAPLSPKASKEFDRVYSLLLKQDLSATSRAKLLASESAWNAYRDKACAIEGAECLTQLAVERTNELEAGWLGEQFW